MFLATVLNFVFDLRCWYESWWLKRDYRSNVRFLPFGLVIKITRARGAHEADILRFVRSHTTIPVPRVILSAQDSMYVYTLMTEVKGRHLEGAWPRLDDKKRVKLIAELRSYVVQLRSLQPTHPNPSSVCGLNGTSIRDYRISTPAVGPFENEAGFNDCLIAAADPFMDPDDLSDIRQTMLEDHRIMFTHGDLAPRNILVDDDGSVAAIVDWENAGWFPEYWELVKALYCSTIEKDAAWEAAVREIVPENYEKELRIDKSMSDHMYGGF